MRKVLVLSLMLIFVGLLGETNSNAAPFAQGNIVVYRVGTGATLTSASTAVFLDEYTTTGVLVQSIPLPTAANGANQPVTASGTATSEGFLTLSVNKQYILFSGYAAAPGVTAIAGTATTANPRVIGRVDASGVPETTTTTTSFSANNIRSVASLDGSNFYAVGANTGVVYQPFGGSGAGTIISSTNTNNRVVNIFGGQLYTSSSAGTNTFKGVDAVGTGLPTTSGQTITRIAGLTDATNPSNYSFFFADLSTAVAGVDTLYVADDSTAANGGGITKFSLVGGNWTSNGVVDNTSAYRGLTGRVSSGSVTLLGTTSTGTSIVSFVDNSGYNAIPSNVIAPTAIATATTNTAFRGVTFAPGTSNVTAAGVSASGKVLNSKGHGISRANVTVTDTTTGDVRSGFTSINGSFNFSNLAAGRFYIVAVNAKRYTFDENQQGLQLFEDNDGLVFKANR